MKHSLLVEKIIALLEDNAAGWEINDKNELRIDLGLDNKDARAINRYGEMLCRKQEVEDRKRLVDWNRATRRLIRTKPEWIAAYKKWKAANPRTRRTPPPAELFSPESWHRDLELDRPLPPLPSP